MGQECLGVSGAVGPDEDGGAVAVGIGDLGQGLLDDGDVVAAVLAPALPGRSTPARASPVLSRKHSSGCWSKPRLLGGRRLLLLGVAGDECGVDVQDQARKAASARADGGNAAAGLGGLEPDGLRFLGPQT